MVNSKKNYILVMPSVKSQIKFLLHLFTLSQDLECGEPPLIPSYLRFGSVTEVTYQCDGCYTGGGSATCSNGEWTQHTTSCESRYYCATIRNKFHNLKNIKTAFSKQRLTSLASQNYTLSPNIHINLNAD